MFTRFTQSTRIILQSQSLWHETASFYWGKFCLRLGLLHTRPCVHQWLNGSFHSSRLPNWGHCWADFMHEFLMPLFACRKHLRLFPVYPFWAVIDNEHIFLDLEEKLAMYFPREWKQDSGKVSITRSFIIFRSTMVLFYISVNTMVHQWDNHRNINSVVILLIHHSITVPCAPCSLWSSGLLQYEDKH